MCAQYGYECRYNEKRRPSTVEAASSGDAPGLNVQHVSKKQKKAASDGQSKESPEVMVDPGILDPFKSRYMSQNSAVAFPRTLGLDLESANPPPLHSFAWNCGIRPEEQASTHISLMQLITLDECIRYSEVYFSTVNHIFGIIERQQFLQTCELFWKGPVQDIVLGAVIGGVIALGSFFSFNQGHPRETDIVRYVKGVLDDPTVSRRPSIDQINAWVLRTLYLRGTTRPHIAWLSSCIAMHLAEATGLHHEAHSVLLATDNACELVESETGELQARRTFWVAWSLNTIMAYEYGRSRRNFDSISCKPVVPVEGDFTAQHILLARLIPGDNTDAETQREELQEGLRKLQQIPDVKDFTCLTRADICFCFYRRLRLLKQNLDKETISCILDIGDKAVEASYDFAQKSCPWWNILGTPFQYFCVLLALDTSESLAKLSWVLKRLEAIVQTLNTPLALEALDTAKVLLRDSMAKKRQELSLLESADSTHILNLEREMDINWDALLDPSYSEVLMTQEFTTY
ncbi:hypothetical protein PVAG01_03369 [Phlyctema vagabunda]|uniref:Xylanolytic transcriptional activator regulatory domain-containing protein n=1 Tax=Phlyctema vagabunda TaxID=108571 RepID=A0ABR4PLH1_9HELO